MIAVRELEVDVLHAARDRIRSIFANKLPVYCSFSGGKDSLVLLDLTLALGVRGDIDLSQLRVEFIDEEAVFPCVVQTVLDWRAKCLDLGVRFDWYALEVRHYSCLNQLECDESFICWDRTKAAVWVREPPPFAIRSHPYLKPRLDTYQAFLARLNDGVHMVGLRTAESVQRYYSVAGVRDEAARYHPRIYPIYDWTDDDVWLYLAQRQIQVPDAYRYMWQLGVARPRLRISQFFSVDTAPILARISEYYPALMEAILRREPAAYLVSLYWDSEMFRRRTGQRRKAEAAMGEAIDYQARVLEMLEDIPAHFGSELARKVAETYRRHVMTFMLQLGPVHYRMLFDGLKAGDPKLRTLRAIGVKVGWDATLAADPDRLARATRTQRAARAARRDPAQ
jgi:predicted phosphoadenosine phosphosulfate sulfurtransferase